MKHLSAFAAAVAFTLSAAQAIEINGSITFGGTVELDTASAGSATSVTAWHGNDGLGSPFVLSRSGDFTSVASFTAVTIAAPYSFNSGAVANFWSVGGFTFDLISSTLTSQTGTSVAASGMGWISGNGFTATLGTWNFSTQDPSAGVPAVFSFSAASGAVPDGGMTVILLGAALSSLGLIRRKLA